MADVLGEVIVDPSTGALVCKPSDGKSRARLTSFLRKIANGTGPSVDGPYFSLDMRVAVALRAQHSSAEIQWSDEAAGWVDNFAASYARLGKARRRLLELARSGAAEASLVGFKGLDRLDPHQLVAVAAMIDPDITGICIFDEQGVGKTVMTVYAYDCLRQLDSLDALLIFAPKNMVEEWKKDFLRFMGKKYDVQTVAGSRGEKYQSVISKADVFVTNYETAHLLEQPLRSLLRRHKGRIALVVDESFFVKNRATRRAMAVRRLRHLCARCWVLCGTPAPNNALDVVHQFDVADGGAAFAGIKLPKEPELLREAIKEAVEHRGVYLRRLKKDVLPGLPDKRFERVAVPMEAEQHRLYAANLTSLVGDVQSTNEEEFRKQFTSFLARRMLLFELCSHPGQVEAGYCQTPGKQTALDGLLEELITRRGEKVVLWSFFRYSLDQLLVRYKRFHPVRLDGNVPDTRLRAESIKRFQEDDTTMLFIANPAAGGAGITLTRSRIAVYESFPVQTAHYLQSLDRIHRRGQTRRTEYFFLLCQDSIEEQEFDRLLKKEKAAMELFGDPEPEVVTREVFLADLLSAMRLLD